ncbi:extracellular solute-binding protein [Bacillus niameyensis]|uniref:extracellular solute-binding protein n=1 Tax=Bacillus niameyensis TaxID=1522308 RepID=UPI000784F421|nr:extracellular solute-binding protein [Bacillus niameyensis]
MKRRILLCFVLLFAMFLVACSNSDPSGGEKQTTDKEEAPENFQSTGYPIVNDSITLQIMGKRSPIQPEWGDMGFFQEMEQLTNIKLDYRTATGDDFTQNKQLAFASLELPDFLYGADLTTSEEVDFGTQGLLIPLEDLIDKYAPNFKKLMTENPDLAASITTPDGHIYALPGIDSSQTSKTPIMWLNGPWLEKLGVDKPQTMDDFYQLLKRFKEEDPGNVGDVIPLTANNPADLRVGLLPNFGIVQQDGIYEDNGIVKYAWIQDEFKEYLKYLNKLYSEKLLDNEMFGHTWEQFIAKGKRTGVFSTWPIVQVGFEDVTEALNYPVLSPMTSSTNDQKLTILMSDIRRGRAAITKDNPYPEATMRWIDHAYSEEGTILARLGIEGKTFKWNDDHQWELLQDPGLSTTETNAKHAPGVGTNVPMVLTEEFFNKEGGNPTILEIYKWVSEELIPYAKSPYPLVYFTEEEQKRISALKPDIDTYFEQAEAKFITGAESIDAGWEKHLETMEKLGINELVSIHQAAYDRWAESQ